MKRKTVDRGPEDIFDEDPKPPNVHLKGKALRKLSRREDDDFY